MSTENIKTENPETETENPENPVPLKHEDYVEFARVLQVHAEACVINCAAALGEWLDAADGEPSDRAWTTYAEQRDLLFDAERAAAVARRVVEGGQWWQKRDQPDVMTQVFDLMDALSKARGGQSNKND